MTKRAYTDDLDPIRDVRIETVGGRHYRVYPISASPASRADRQAAYDEEGALLGELDEETQAELAYQEALSDSRIEEQAAQIKGHRGAAKDAASGQQQGARAPKDGGQQQAARSAAAQAVASALGAPAQGRGGRASGPSHPAQAAQQPQQASSQAETQAPDPALLAQVTKVRAHARRACVITVLRAPLSF